jgi:adenylosuccinate lyase
MLKNLELTRGLIFSGQLLLALTQKGISREEAYVWIQRNAMKVWDEGGNFKDYVLSDSDIRARLSKDEIEQVFDLRYYLRHVDSIFDRVFSS